MEKVIKISIFLIAILSIANAKLSKEEILKQMQAEAALLNETGAIYELNNTKAKETSSKKINKDTYRDVALYHLITMRERELDRKPSYNDAKKVDFLANNLEDYKKRLAEQKKLEEAKNKKDEKAKIYNLTGYCRLRNTVEVDRVQGYSVLDCDFTPNDLGLNSSEMFATFVPVYERLALIGRPVYLNVHHNKVPIQNGVILTVDQTNLNLATFINDVKIKKLLADMALSTNKIAYQNSMAYITELQASRKSEKVVVVPGNNGNNTVEQESNTAKPKAKDYITIAGIQILSSIIDALGNFYKENSYPLFRIDKGTHFYVDFNIEVKGKIKQNLIDYKEDEYKKLNFNMEQKNGR